MNSRLLFNKKKDKKQNIYDNLKTIQSPDIFNNITEKNNRPAFKGGVENGLTKNIAKIINNKQIQNFVIKHNFNENNGCCSYRFICSQNEQK